MAAANRNDSILLEPTLEHLARFDHGLGFGLPEHITVHLEAGYDSHKTRERLAILGCEGRISTKGAPLQADTRWVVERTNFWRNWGFRKLLICTERRTRVIEAFIALANAIIILRRLIRQVWTTHRWEKRPERRSDLSAQSLSAPSAQGWARATHFLAHIDLWGQQLSSEIPWEHRAGYGVSLLVRRLCEVFSCILAGESLPDWVTHDIIKTRA